MNRPNFLITLVFIVMLAACVLPAAAQRKTAAPKSGAKSSAKSAPAKPVAPASAAVKTQLTELEKELFLEINSLRANPAKYLERLEQMKSKFKGNVLKQSDAPDLVTNEGAAAVNDAIAFLKLPRNLKAFTLSQGLSRAADDHLRDMMLKDISGHKGSDGSLPPARTERYGSWSGGVKENISYQAVKVTEIVLNMLVDDGNPKRDHRKNLLSPDLKFLGLAAGDSSRQGRLCVFVFAGSYTEKKASGNKLGSY